MTEYTRTPWMYSKNRNTHDSCIHTISAIENRSGYIDLDTGGVVGSSEWIWIKDEDAEHIVRCVNSHDDLVAALELARKRIEYLGAVNNHSRHFDINKSVYLPTIDAALQKAKA